MHLLTDDQLMAEVKRGDRKAFSTLLERHGAAVFGLCLRLFPGNRAQAEDVTQEVWMRVLEKCEQYRPEGHFKAWLMTIARNQAFSELRKSVRFVGDEAALEAEAQPGEGVEELLSTHQDMESVKAAIHTLPDEQRVSLVLWLEGNMDYEEIATELRVSLSCVKTLIFRAKGNLKKKLGEI